MAKRINPDSIISGASAIKSVKIDGLSITTKPVAHYFKHVISATDTLTVTDDGLLTHVVNRNAASTTLTIDGMDITMAPGFSLQSIPLSPGMEVTTSALLTIYVEPIIISF